MNINTTIRVILTAGSLSGIMMPCSLALPSGQQVTSGSATFTLAGSTLTIKQSTDKLITNWKSFSVGSAETTQFLQPSSTSAALNRVNGGAASLIDGKLLANGRVVLINPAGITVGKTGVVNVNRFTASTQDIADADFLNDGEDFFYGASQAGIQNLGTIHASGGDAILIAQAITNSGKILAPAGTVGLAAGTQVRIKPSGEERIFIQPASIKGGAVTQTVSGSIQAATAEVKAAGNPYAVAINLSGIVTATGAAKVTPKIIAQSGNGNLLVNADAKLTARSAAGQGGRIALNANAAGGRAYPVGPGDFVTVNVLGSLDATGTAMNQAGGAISAFGDSLQLGLNARFDVSGNGDAGKIHLEGIDRLEISSGGSATGGLWANSILGNGGTIHLLAGGDGSVIIHSTARISASLSGNNLLQGAKSAGHIRIGGGLGGAEGLIGAGKTVIEAGAQIAASGSRTGNGGTIGVWSATSASVAGSFQAKGGMLGGNGGLVEISADQVLEYTGLTDTTAPYGLTGNLVLDPDNILIKSATNLAPIYTLVPVTTSILTTQTLLANLALTNVTVETDTNSVGYGEVFTGSGALFGDTQFGKIVLADDLVWNPGLVGPTSLTLNAQGSILLLASIANLSGGNVNLNADTNNQYGGDVFVGSGQQTKAISVESLGQISVEGQRVFVLGSNTTKNASAQIGNGNFTHVIGGDISVNALGTNAPAVGVVSGYANLGAINLLAGTKIGSFAQIGSGGSGKVMNTRAGASVISNIVLTATNGDVSAIASAGEGAYAQIGHGGFHATLNGLTATGLLTLNLTLNAQRLRLKAGTGTGSYAQLGHGGFASVLNLRNKLTADTTVALTGTNGRVLDIDAGFGQSNVNGGYAQIGLGGASAEFNVLSQSAFIRIVANGANAILRVHNGVSEDYYCYAQIGHGGFGSAYGTLAEGNHLFDPAKNTVFSSAPITLNAANGTVEVWNDNSPSSGSTQYARIGHGQTFSANEHSTNSHDPNHIELSYGNVNLTLNAKNVVVHSVGADSRIGHGAGDLADIGHLSQSSTIYVHTTGYFEVDGPLAIIGTGLDGSEWDLATTAPGISSTRKLILDLSSNVHFANNGAYAADGITGLVYLP